MKNIFTLKNIALALLVLVVAIGLCLGLSYLWKYKESDIDSELRKYQSVIIKNETELLTSQLVKYVVQGKELAKSRIFRASIEGLSSRDKNKFEKAQQDFENFVKVSGFASGSLFDLNGKLFATSEGQLDGNEADYHEAIRKTASTRVPSFSPLHAHGGLFVSDLFLPVFPADALSNSVAPVKVLVLTVPMTDALRAFLATEQSLEYGSSIHLVQQTKGVFQEIVFSYPDNLKLQTIGASLEGVTGIDFGKRSNLYNSEEVFSSAGFIPAIGWWIGVETSVDEVAEQMNLYKGVSALLAALGLGAFIFFVLTVSFIFSSRKYYLKSKKLETKLVPAEQERVLLKKVFNSLPTPISVKDVETGTLIYINEAFAGLADLKNSETEGLTYNQVFDSRDAESLSHGDQMVSMSGNAYSHEMDVTKGAKKLIMQVQGIPCSVKEKK